MPLYNIDKTKSYVKKYIQLLEKVSKDADEFYIATDYDIEGELLGYNALRFACDPKDRKVQRMKFSTLTHGELSNAFQNPIDVDLKLVEAGETVAREHKGLIYRWKIDAVTERGLLFTKQEPVPVDRKTIFSDYKGRYKSRIEKRQRRLIVKTTFIKFVGPFLTTSKGGIDLMSIT